MNKEELAQEYVNSKLGSNESLVFKEYAKIDYLAGYNKAEEIYSKLLERAKEHLKVAQTVLNDNKCYYYIFAQLRHCF